MTTPTDGSEDVNDFLLRIRELGERRDKEDDERTKRLEDEILQGRKERQARRAERARSIADSPTLNPSRLSVSSLGPPSIDPPEHLEPTLQTQSPETPGGANSIQEAGPLDADEKRRGSVQDSETESPSRTRPTLSRSRAGTLSWQQRPQSRDFGSRSPGSTSPTRSSHLRNASTASEENQLSRAQIANSLSSKDPTWFRQTADRGFGSPAFRKNEERLENQADLGPSCRLPGMSRESTVEPEHEDDSREKSPSPPRTASTVGESYSSHRFSSVSSVSPATGTASPVAISDAPKLDPPQAEAPADDPMPPSPTQRRMSPERARSTSPTKGLGGFVQSAMMKRSDTVSKRWSAQIPQGLSRSNSVISNRSSVAVPTLGTSVSDMTPTAASRGDKETSSLPTQRPNSSHSEATVHLPETDERPKTPSYTVNDTTARTEASPSRSRYSHARSTSSITTDSQNDGPSSPYTSRTMDPKRWSPTKASWLESALNRPESPRTQRPPSLQPSWATHRQSRGSVDMGRVNNFKEVTPVGLMRTPPPGSHFKKPSITGPQSIFGSPIATKPKEPFPEPHAKSTDDEPLAAKTETEEGVMEEPEAKHESLKAEPVKTDVAEKVKEEEVQSPSPVTSEPQIQEQPVELEGLSKQVPTRKSPPPPLSPKPNFSRPTRGPISPKPQPQNPAMDFRANLRKREVVKDSGEEKQPEFKNVFGRLKKTETRNYVAPDELKSNILRGKAALNVTGGPKKTERVDELKESLVKQKEAMKAGGGSIRRKAAEEKDVPEKPHASVPEAIAKRHTMTKSNSTRRPNTEQNPEISTGISPERPFLDRVPLSPSVTEEKPTQEESRETSPTANEPRAITTDSPLPASPVFDEKPPREQPRELSPIQPEPKAIGIDSQPSSSPKEKPKDALPTTRPWMRPVEKAPQENNNSSVRGLPSAKFATARTAAANPGPAAKGKLAGRINPALAGILSRGPPATPESPKSPVALSGDSSPVPPSAPLTHMTKGRAKGPNRRLPKGDTAPAVSSAEDTKEVGAISSPEVKPSQTSTPEPSLPSEPPSERQSKSSLVLDTETVQKTESSFFQKLPGVNTSFQDALNSGLQQRLGRFSPLSSPSSPSESSLPGRGDRNSIRGLDSPRPMSPSSKPVPPPKSTSPSPSPSTPTTKPQWAQSTRYMSASPSPLRTSFNENSRELPPTPPHKVIPGVTVASASPRNSQQVSPPVPSKRSDIALDKPADHRLSRKMSAPSLVAQAAEAREVIAGFFKTYPHPRDRMDIDPQLMLLEKPEDPKIRTVKRHIWEITGGGKRQELPINQEYVLYEGSMYVCVHSFEADGSNGSEVYLWCGDDVSEAALEDAQLFARKIARENSCKLQVIRQGKEQVRFIQALGGIIITRRGSSSRHTSSALYMLCGRKHLGHMAFDEVDYSLRNLCSGFPYVISAPFGNMYLWKGKGSGPEETGAARLISMDLGLTGEFEEVAEGEEPESFYEVFAGSREASPHMSSDYWQLKPKSDHFGTRLLRVDHELGQPSRFWMRRPGSGSPVVRPNDTVQEVEPFCYKDLTERGVYVLDTFFEIYVIVGEQASQKSAEFASAVVFAHEYGILAASLQDRPFIPKSFVALGGIPDRCQSAFRKWDPRALLAPCVFPLDVAIEALRSEDRP